MESTYPIWPSLVTLTLWAAWILAKAKYHGKPMKGEHHVGYTIVNVGIIGFLLFKGGYFHALLQYLAN